MARIFISHSKHDKDEAVRLKTWLADRAFGDSFIDTDIPPGEDWEKIIYRRLEGAQAVLLVLTERWHESKWCFAELIQARALGKDIIPLFVAPTRPLEVGKDLQYIDLQPNRQAGLERLEQRLSDIARQSADGFELAKGLSPFPGLAAFEEDRAAVFFGREPDVHRMLERLRVRHTLGGARLILLLGASGSGKSSLLRAGLIPRLKRDRRNWIALPPFRPGRSPRAQLVECLLAGVGDVGFDRVAQWRSALEGEAPATALAEVARTLRHRHAAPDASILLPIDQMEESLTLAGEAERTAFFTLLSHALDEALPFVAVATLRSDYLAGLQSAPALTVAFDSQSLDPIPLDRIAALVRGPARVARLRVEDGLIDALTRDAGRPDALPLVAVALSELYARFGGGALTLAGYESLGARGTGLSPLDAVVRDRAEAALGSSTRKDEDDRALRDAFVPWLVRLQEDSGLFVRQAAALNSFPAPARAQLERLVEARLLVRRGGGTPDDPAMVEATHEALFRVWPRLAGWLDEERDFLIGKRRIEQAFQDWRRLPEDRKDGGLLTGAILDSACDWLTTHPTRFGQEEGEFIRRSDAMAQAEAARKRRYLTAAIRTANGLVFDLVLKFRHTGLPNAIRREILQHARHLLDQLATDHQDDLSLQRTRSVTLNELAQSLADFGDPKGAKKAAEDSLAIMRRLVEKEPGNTGFQRDLSISLDKVADLQRRNDPDGARALVEESLGIRRRLAEREPDNTEFQRDLSVSLNKVADRQRRDDPDGARALVEESLGIARRLAEREPDNTEFQRDLSISLEKVADIQRRNDPDGARALYEESLGICRRLAEREPDNTEFQTDVVVSLHRIAQVGVQPERHLSEALAILTRLNARGLLSSDQKGWISFLENALREARGQSDPPDSPTDPSEAR
ncbi:toll/interleukin-1 receptor domain-containing protein [Azospirillum tabaci]|uniref:toll/interleukin-1 receptor domain-containing protein n=1 Tax=Azospirillum tabaci TaxID=2752310 RepID=UPI0016610EBD|nr:toll/interleukin-1 receptor domain-containing protein [Azospirillum tabaci]